MSNSNLIFFKKITNDPNGYKYEVIKRVKITVDKMKLGKWDLIRNSDNKKIASADGDTLIVNKGFKWDGCTGIGAIYETDKTLTASVLHDILYCVLKTKGYKAAFTYAQADYWFTQMLKLFAGFNWLHLVYLFGVRTIGSFWKLTKSDKYRIISK